MHKNHVVVIGGGTGSFTLLSSLKNYFSQLTAIVNMSDNGGSSGVLRDELGVLPPGDVRQCLVALSDASSELRELFNFRFPEGSSLAGHSFGNLFLSAVEMQSKDFSQAVELARQVLRIRADVIPVTLDDCHLVLRKGKQLIKGEASIASVDFSRLGDPELFLVPSPTINPRIPSALDSADLIVIAPGNLYRSLLPVLLVEGMSSMLAEARAPVVYVANLVNKAGETDGFSVADYVSELERVTSSQFIDIVLYNTNSPSAEILKTYALEGEYPVKVDEVQLRRGHYRSVGGDFLSHKPQVRNKNDTRIYRSLIRHDADVISQELIRIIT